MDVSVLVVTWNSARDIAACLDAALAQEGVDLEVIVVDNASADDTREVLAGFAADPRVTVLLQAD
ncbi:MAG: glycosyltransferase, partial [Pseudorhodobacter sp.]|nr:glycosyltransferase [Frankiaceae bacterium]